RIHPQARKRRSGAGNYFGENSAENLSLRNACERILNPPPIRMERRFVDVDIFPLRGLAQHVKAHIRAPQNQLPSQPRLSVEHASALSFIGFVHLTLVRLTEATEAADPRAPHNALREIPVSLRATQNCEIGGVVQLDAALVQHKRRRFALNELRWMNVR